MARLQSIEAEIDVPEIVELKTGAKKVSVDARVTLRNTGAEDVVVHAASSDDRHFWHVFDGNHREILRERRAARAKASRKDGVHSFRTETVPGGQEIHSSRELSLPANKLREGEIYTVRAEFFGHLAEGSFSVVSVPAAALRKPAKKKAKKSPTKKAAKKKPAKAAAAKKPTKKKAARKTAKKKPARKKPGRKKASRKK